MLDDLNVIAQRDPSGALAVAADQPNQARFEAVIENAAYDHRPLSSVVVSGMGGSTLSALFVKAWLKDELEVPFEVLRSYDVPAYVNQNTLFIASSYSGNTEETLSSLHQAQEKGAQLAILAAGGNLGDIARHSDIAYVALPEGLQPRMALIYSLRGLVALLVHFGVVDPARLDDIKQTADWLASETTQWLADQPTDKNYAKQLALHAVGKTAVFYGGQLTAPLAYKWKISWNEDSKNVSFWNEYSEFNHNEFIGWTSHPIEKPYAVFDLISPLEHPQILKRFEISDRLLSGLRPKATAIHLQGTSLIAQLLWGGILADFVAIYVAILNHVDPVPVALIEKLKSELL